MTLRRIPVLVLAALGSLAAAGTFVHYCVLRVPLHKVLGPWFSPLVTALLFSTLACAAWLVLEIGSSRRGSAPISSPGLARAWFVAGVATWIAFLFLVHPLDALWIEAGLGVGFGLLAATALLAGPFSRLPIGLRRGIDILLFTFAAAVLGLELGMRAIAWIHPTQLFARFGDMPADILRKLRSAPGEIRYGFPCNSTGHYDDEFERRKPGGRLVVTIGDSFSYGVVPHDYHYTTVCERILGVPVDNMGIPAIGPPEYLTLLVEEALPLDPDVVVIGLFVGNDLVLGQRSGNRWTELARPWLDRDSVFLWLVPHRLERIAEERRLSGRAEPLLEAPGADQARARIEDPQSVLSNMPWLADPMLEGARFSEEGFHRLEAGRAQQNCTAGSSALAECFNALRAIRNSAGSTPVVVLLIPDEFQVEDAVWQDASSDPGVRGLDRDHPQKIVVPWLASHGYEVLDLLPVLRAVPPLVDGRRHLYHLRDSHFNARGNKVAGEALAEFLRPRLPATARR